jgi:hypothetical protein
MAGEIVGPKPFVVLVGRTSGGDNVPVRVDDDGLLAGGGNPFDQDLNTTDDVEFNSVTVDTAVLTVNGLRPVTGVGGSHTSAGNVDNGLTTVYDLTVPAGLLASAGDALEIEALMIGADNGADKTSFLYFGATVIASVTATTQNIARLHKATVMRTGAATQISGAVLSESGSVLVQSAAPTETLANAIHIYLKLIATTTDDIVAKYLKVKFVPAGTQV